MEFKWEEQGDKDFICRVGEYMLRAEQMQPGLWWFCVYLGNDKIEHGRKDFVSSLGRAQGLCEGLVMGIEFQKQIELLKIKQG